jgi:hypothetical protein
MSLMDITSESLSRQLDREVPEVYVVVAKHDCLGMAAEGIKEVIGCTDDELAEVLNDPLYREVRLIAGAMHAQQTIDQSTGVDKLEELALKNLIRRAELPNADPEFMLRVFAVANKAQRRARAGKEDGVLDSANGSVKRISLTTRLVRKFDRDGSETQTVERQLSLHDGSMQNPSFDEVDGLLTVHGTPVLPRAIEVKTSTPDIRFDELDKDMQERGA